jgi:hypothetical protein
MPIRFLAIDFLKKVLAIVGCLLFALSLIYPFYFIWFPTLAGGTSIYYWSYKADYRPIINWALHSNQHWFSDYWFSSYFVGFRIPWILVSMLTLQALTLAFGIASVVFSRRILSFAPVLFSLPVLALIIGTSWMLSSRGLLLEYQLGYYLIYPSIILFVSASVLTEAARRNKQETVKIPAPLHKLQDLVLLKNHT